MKHTKVKVTVFFFTLIILLVSFLFSGLLNNVKTASAEAKEENNTFEYSDYIPDDHVSETAMSATPETESKSVDLVCTERSSLHVFSSSQDIISSILSDDTFTIKGTISVVTNTTVALNDYYDFSSLSRFDIADWAYKANFISEKEKIETYCNLIINRNFTNIDCLNGVVEEIRLYAGNNAIDFEDRNKINSVLDPQSNFSDSVFSTTAIKKEATYSSANFIFHYDSSRTVFSNVQSTANYMENVRTKYLNFGFRTPILKSGESRYHIYLDPDADSTAAGRLISDDVIKDDKKNTRTSHIYIYSFAGLKTDTEEVLAHEYFHAIQYSYNYAYTWFTEACANWGKIVICESINTAATRINSFIDMASTVSMPLSEKYGAVLFPLTIHKEYGGASAILSIYKEYNKQPADASEETLRAVITNGIVNNGYPSGSFEVAYRKMASYLIRPGSWFDKIPDVDEKNWNSPSHWIHATPSYVDLSNWARPVTYAKVDYLTSHYYGVFVPVGYSNPLNFIITPISGACDVQTYIIDKNGHHTISYKQNTTNGRCYVEVPYADGNVNELFIVVSNTSTNGVAEYSLVFNYGNIEKDISFSSYDRYIERLSYIPQGAYVDYSVTFRTIDSLNIIFQTFGEYDTILELYSPSGTLLASNDDSGYLNNALVRYSVSANTNYRVRVRFYSSVVYGIIKLAISSAYGNYSLGVTSLKKYEDIYALSSSNYTWNGYIERYYVKLFRFIPISSGTYTFELFSDFDNFVYVIDPRYADAIVENEDYNDNCGQYDQWEGYWTDYNAKLTKKLSANVPYLIIYSGTVPLFDYGNLTLKISKQA